MSTSTSIRRCQPLLGTFVEISLAAARDERELLAFGSAAFAEIRRIDALMSFHRTDSELSRINREAAHATQTVSDDMRAVLAEALWLSELSNGRFDISIGQAMIAHGKLPDHGVRADAGAHWRDIDLDGNRLRFRKPLIMDLGGIAKGYAVDCALACIPTDVDACINAGGDLRMRPWRGRTAAIRHSHANSRAVLPCSMRDAALATSAVGRDGQLGMIIDPGVGRAADGVGTCSVFAATAMRADGLTKVACLVPDPADIIHAAGAQAIHIDGSGKIREIGFVTSEARRSCA